MLFSDSSCDFGLKLRRPWWHNVVVGLNTACDVDVWVRHGEPLQKERVFAMGPDVNSCAVVAT